jgi:hypothetical protein
MNKLITVLELVLLFSLLLTLLPEEGKAIIVTTPIQNTPPIISASYTQTNCSIFNINGELWANVDIEYKMKAIYNLGNSFSRPYEGGFKIVTDTVNAHYPVPISAQNISVKINNQEISWQYDNKGFCHIFDLNLPEINWTIGPVPKTFTVSVHYVQPIPKNNPNSLDMGQYALVLPMIPRFGSTDTPSFPLYSWFDFGTSTSNLSIQAGQDITLLDAYLLERGNGSLSEVEYSTNNTREIQFQIQGQWDSKFAQQSFPYGAVIFSSQTCPKSSPVTNNEPIIQDILLIIMILIIALVTIVEMRKRKLASFPKGN